MDRVEQYARFELALDNVRAGKPVEYCAEFEHEGEKVTVPAFWAGDRYRVRFMPMKTGAWRYRVTLGRQTWQGTFTCVENTGPNKGPVYAEGRHFRYADGSRYLPFGTTCYAWTHQTEELQSQTLESLAGAPFNKLRMCVFPKSMPYNSNDPAYYPFHKDAQGNWDVQSPDERYWQNLDTRIAQLAALGIEADLILFHPYDRWGFSKMTMEDSLAYLEYCVARLAAYANIWWSLANEYDFIFAKTNEDWNRIGAFVREADPYGHLLSIHNCFGIYPRQPWMTHCSIQQLDVRNVPLWSIEYELPIVVDECGYEGTLEYDWGNLSGREMTHRFWGTVCRGGYCTHGETFHREDEILWWAKGGPLHGESPRRIHFLREIVDSLPGNLAFEGSVAVEGDPNDMDSESGAFQNLFAARFAQMDEPDQRMFLLNHMAAVVGNGDCRLQYFGICCQDYCDLALPENGKYRVELLDTWEMTREAVLEQASGKTRVPLPGREHMAVLVTRLEGAALI